MAYLINVLPQEVITELFEYRDGELYWLKPRSNRLKVGQLAGDKDGRGYRRIMVGTVHYKMHVLIWIMFNGPIPEDALVDHEDKDISHNCIENLRLLTKSGNNRNRDASGVTFDETRSKWRAQSSVGDTTVFLGRFNTREEAEHEYKEFCEFMLTDGGERVSERS